MSYSRIAFVCLAGFLLPHHPVAAQTMEEAAACMPNVYNSPEAALIRPHVPTDPMQVTSAQLSDPARPTSAEIAVIKAIYPRLRECRKQVLVAVSKTLPSLVPATERIQAADAEDWRLLAQGKLSWGAAVTHARERVMIAQGEIQQLPEYRAAQAKQAQRQQQAQRALLEEEARLATQQRAAQIAVTRPCVPESYGNVFGALAMALAPCPAGTPRPYTESLERQLQPAATPLNCMDLGSGIISCQQGLRTFTCLRSSGMVSCQ